MGRLSDIKNKKSGNDRKGRLSDDVIKMLTDNTEDIKVKNEGILNLPEGAFKDWAVSKLVTHFIGLAKSKGVKAVMNAILNLERWNKTDNPEISTKARSVINALEGNSEWEDLKE
jgi:hypothetical protein